jgi:hypothetical protein
LKDYYAILEIAINSDDADIRKAYRRLAKKYHPDINKSSNAQEKFIEITEAYEFLTTQPKHLKVEYSTATSKKQEDIDYRASEEYERFRRECREKAEQQAKMRYEVFKKQHEAFQKSGINDFALLFTIIVRIALILIFIFLLFLPVYVAYHDEWVMIFLLVITWPFAGIIAWYIKDNRKNYFMPGNFYYTPQIIKQIYSEVHPTEQKCYFSSSRYADSNPYKLNLLKLKDLKIATTGFRQHNVNYINEDITILIPRSRKAFIIHSVNSIIKIFSILSCLIFLDISSLVWRTIIGIIIGEIVSTLVLLITSTRSNTSYLMNYGTAFRVAVWLFAIVQVSHFSIAPFNISTSDYIYLVITVIVLFDCFLMQLTNFAFKKYSSRPIIKQYAEVKQKFNEGYTVYNDITIISVLFPFFKWIFG